ASPPQIGRTLLPMPPLGDDPDRPSSIVCRQDAGSARRPLGRSNAMRILLAGAPGVIGRQTVPVLAAAGHQVIGLARTPGRLPGAELVVADALDPAGVAPAVRAAAPEVLVHKL